MGVDDAEAVRAEHGEAGLGTDRRQFLLAGEPLGASLDESAGPDDAGPDAGGGAFANHGADNGGGHGEDGEIGRHGQVRHARVAAQAGDRLAAAVDRKDRAGRGEFEEEAHGRPPDIARLVGGSDHRDRARRQQPGDILEILFVMARVHGAPSSP